MATPFVINFVSTNTPNNYLKKTYTKILEYKAIANTNPNGLDIIDPVFRIRGVSNLKNSNYLYTESSAGTMPTRYYYITKIVPITDTTYDVYCHEDVLMTFSNYILQFGVGLVTQSGGNAMYNDGSVPKPTCLRVSETQEFKDGFTPKNPTYILLTSGGDNNLSTDY